MRALLVLLLVAGCAHVEPAPDPAVAAATDARAAKIAELESVFWHCDYVATTKGVLAAPMAACRYATEELKRLKFDGKYGALLTWWRENKVAEHRKVEEARRGGAI